MNPSRTLDAERIWRSCPRRGMQTAGWTANPGERGIRNTVSRRLHPAADNNAKTSDHSCRFHRTEHVKHPETPESPRRQSPTHRLGSDKRVTIPYPCDCHFLQPIAHEGHQTAGRQELNTTCPAGKSNARNPRAFVTPQPGHDDAPARIAITPRRRPVPDEALRLRPSR